MGRGLERGHHNGEGGLDAGPCGGWPLGNHVLFGGDGADTMVSAPDSCSAVCRGGRGEGVLLEVTCGVQMLNILPAAMIGT